GCGAGPVSLGAAAYDLPAQLCIVLRARSLVPPELVFQAAPRGLWSHHLCELFSRPAPGPAAADRDLRRGALRLLHGVSRRTRRAKAAPAAVDVLLPDDRPRRSPGRRLRGSRGSLSLSSQL